MIGLWRLFHMAYFCQLTLDVVDVFQYVMLNMVKWFKKKKYPQKNIAFFAAR